jgi:hypothetical protein
MRTSTQPAGTPFLTRYLAGEHEQVWEDLVALGAVVRDAPYLTDAQAVARETMRRVSHNLHLLIPRLHECGYRFGYQWAVEQGISSPEQADELELGDPVLSPPSRHIRQVIHELEQRVGMLPLSLQAFYEEVGGVNFVGAHPIWGAYGLDALVVTSAEQLMALDDLAHWGEDKEEDGTCALLMAPDEHHKYFVSGDLYLIRVPAPAADALVVHERHHTTFVNYLRICLQWAGLPNLEQILQAAPQQVAEIALLTRDLVPL